MPLFRELWAEEVVTAPGLVHWIEQQPERAAMRAWVADTRGEVVGFANSRLRWALQAEGIAGIWSGVLPAFRRRGLGTRLFETAAEHIVRHGARRLESTVRDDEPDARAFARRLGFEEGRSEQYWELEVGSAAVASSPSAARSPSSGCARCAIANASSSSCTTPPSATCRTTTRTRWRSRTGSGDARQSRARPRPERRRPRRRPAGCLRLAHRRPGGGARGQRDDRNGAGVSPARSRAPGEGGDDRLGGRGRIRTIVTSNDTTNADMLALNEHLGYRPSVLRISVAKDV